MKSNKNTSPLERAKNIAGLGLVVGGLLSIQGVAIVFSGETKLHLEGTMFLFPKVLLIIGAISIFFSAPLALGEYSLAALISVAATVLGFLLYSLPVPMFIVYHVPAFIFYSAMIWLLLEHLRKTAKNSFQPTSYADD